MKIALICPSNLLYMPYINNYKEVLENEKVQFDIINWDRFKIEEDISISYVDQKIGHQRNYIDYLKFKKFIIKNIKKNAYDKVIVFGIQLGFFLKSFLERNYYNRFILDIRDDNRVRKIMNIKKLITSSFSVVISSAGYLEWLPKCEKYFINHNTKYKHPINESFINPFKKDKINISYIGALRDYEVNIKLINAVKDSEYINLSYHGEGVINNKLNRYIEENSIKNIKLTGRYQTMEEETLYRESDIINVLRFNDSLNNKTALPNRLYNAVYFGKLLIALQGTYLATIIKDYNIGLVVEDFTFLDKQLKHYLENITEEEYRMNRDNFFENINKDNNQFVQLIKLFSQKTN